ncbi:hypothetical protein BDW02DRAFT_567715 [Decorospora gaudefroyi]|uniref:Uncharacterized protein n=1 Tax=Decorospora gaudefroyi TaxID=184978 RepID=A0A6A5KJL5_9PLEO|nr:hypothetical protein BDW02DRAFT_567715 [Decorospora gaudefroyi]
MYSSSHTDTEEEWDGFCSALKECWRRIPTKLIRRLIMSMPRRIAACKKAQGWQTNTDHTRNFWPKNKSFILYSG